MAMVAVLQGSSTNSEGGDVEAKQGSKRRRLLELEEAIFDRTVTYVRFTRVRVGM
jgi:hypothetical protein